jgi:hypothetical protein
MASGGTGSLENQVVRNNLSDQPFNKGNEFSNNYITTSSSFVDPSNYDFTLTAGSPAIDYGMEIPGITDGYVGVAPDVGAYEFGGEYWMPGTNTMMPDLSEVYNYSKLPETPKILVGEFILCEGQDSVVYTIEPVIGATSYEWTLPDGVTGTSSTNSIAVKIDTSFTQGNISVKGINNTGSGAQIERQIIVKGDSDNDGVCDKFDICEGNDTVDTDSDGVPDACDICSNGDDSDDNDHDGTPDSCDMNCSPIVFETEDILSYDAGSQDMGSAQLLDSTTIKLYNNAWKAIELKDGYISSSTILEFDFKSDAQGEEHGIGFDSDLILTNNLRFKLYGTQDVSAYSFTNFNNYSGTEYKHYVIPVGEYLTGSYTYLTFISDHDASPMNGTSYFKNLKIYDGSCNTILFDDIPEKAFGDPDFELSATNTLGLDVTFQSSDTNVIKIAGTTASVIAIGEATITVSQDGDGNYESAVPVSQIVTVVKADQSITFDSIPVKVLGDDPFTLTATSTSGLPVTFISGDNTVATISGDTVTIIGVGTTNITAQQAGNNNYNAAPDVSKELSVRLTNVDLTNDQNIVINPNPVDNYLMVTLKEPVNEGIISFYSADGKLVLRNKLEGNSFTIDISSFQPGIYIVKIGLNEGEFVKQIIKK